jgi:hypothetical protein
VAEPFSLKIRPAVPVPVPRLTQFMQQSPQELLSSVARRINTGTDNPETSRALIVFNLTSKPLSGAAVFRASMSWPRERSLPPVVVTDGEGIPIASALREMTQGADSKGRADRVQLSFALYFTVKDVPANGWCTYLAAYANTPAFALEDFIETPGLVVVETTRHRGDLPLTGTLEPGA